MHFITVTQHYYLFCLRFVWKLGFKLLTIFEKEKKRICCFRLSSTILPLAKKPIFIYIPSCYFSTFVAAVKPVAPVL